MDPYLKQQFVGYSQIIIIVMTENPSIGVALRLIYRFAVDSTIQGGEGKGGN